MLIKRTQQNPAEIVGQVAGVFVVAQFNKQSGARATAASGHGLAR